MKGKVQVSFLTLEEQYDIVTRAIKMIYRVSNMTTYLLHTCVFDQVTFDQALKKSETRKISQDKNDITYGAKTIQRDRSNITRDIVFLSRCYNPDKGTSML